MSHEIIRNRVPVYNNTVQNIIAERKFSVGYPVLNNATNYTVAIESATVDLSQAILDPEPSYKVMIFCDLKEESGLKPAGLNFGPNYFTFNEPLVSADQFLIWLNNILGSKPYPFNLGGFSLDSEDFFNFGITQEDYDAAYVPNYFQVYFNEPLNTLLSDFTMNNKEQHGGELYHELAAKPGNYKASVDRMYRLNKIESILFLTDLPVTPTSILNVDIPEASPMNILGSVELNNLQYNIRMKSDWRYQPQLLREYTMNLYGTIHHYSVQVVLQYNNTKTRTLTLAPGERFIVNLAFFPRKVLE